MRNGMRSECIEKYLKLSMSKHTICEIISSEKVYVENLTLLVDRWLVPLENRDIPMVNTSNLAVLKYIQSIHSNFYAELCENLSVYHSETSVLRLSQVFHTYIPFMKSYKLFISNFDSIGEEVKKWKSLAGYRDFMRGLGETENGFNLSSLLILAVQRIPRYRLFFETIVREFGFSKENDPFESFRTLLSIKQLAIEINFDVGLTAKKFEFLEFLTKIKGNPRVELSVSGRIILKKGKWIKRNRNKKWNKVYGVVFNDLILYGRKASGKLTVSHVIPVNPAFRVFQQEIDSERGIVLFSSVKSFFFKTENDEEWMDSFSKVSQTRNTAESAVGEEVRRRMFSELSLKDSVKWNLKEVSLFLLFCDCELFVLRFVFFEVNGVRLLNLTIENLVFDMYINAAVAEELWVEIGVLRDEDRSKNERSNVNVKLVRVEMINPEIPFNTEGWRIESFRSKKFKVILGVEERVHRGLIGNILSPFRRKSVVVAKTYDEFKALEENMENYRELPEFESFFRMFGKHALLEEFLTVLLRTNDREVRDRIAEFFETESDVIDSLISRNSDFQRNNWNELQRNLVVGLVLAVLFSVLWNYLTANI